MTLNGCNGSSFPVPHPLPQAGEGVQGTALVPPRTPAVRLACLDIKNLISGCLFDQSDAGATGVQPDKPPARLAFSFPHFFWRRKRNGVGCRAETRPPASNQAHRPNKKQQRPPSPPSPSGGRSECGPLPNPLPQAGEGAMQRIVSSLGQAATVLQCTCAISGIAAIKSLVYWCCGSSSTACASPTSTSWPRCMTPMSSHIWRITARLWLMSR